MGVVFEGFKSSSSAGHGTENLEDIMSSETNQTQRDGCLCSRMWNLKRPGESVLQMVTQLTAVSCVLEEARGRS